MNNDDNDEDDFYIVEEESKGITLAGIIHWILSCMCAILQGIMFFLQVCIFLLCAAYKIVMFVFLLGFFLFCVTNLGPILGCMAFMAIGGSIGFQVMFRG